MKMLEFALLFTPLSVILLLERLVKTWMAGLSPQNF